MKNPLIVAIAALALSACSTPVEPQLVVVTVPVLQTVEVPIEVTVEVPVEVTRIVVATPAGPTATPVPTATLAPTADFTKTDKGNGSYLSGIEMAAGIWRSVRVEAGNYSDGDCYLSINSYGGDLQDNTFSPLGATIRVPTGEHLVLITYCVWSFLQP